MAQTFKFILSSRVKYLILKSLLYIELFVRFLDTFESLCKVGHSTRAASCIFSNSVLSIFLYTLSPVLLVIYGLAISVYCTGKLIGR